MLVSVLLAAYPDSQITILLPSTGYPSDLTPTEAESEAMNSMCFSSGMPQATLILPFHIVALLRWLLVVLLIIGPALMLAVAKLVSALRCMTIRRRHCCQGREAWHRDREKGVCGARKTAKKQVDEAMGGF